MEKRTQLRILRELLGQIDEKANVDDGVQHLIFGRNEPAQHDYRNTFREALNLLLLEKI